MKTRILAGLAAATLALAPAPTQAGHGRHSDAAAWAIGGLIVGAVAGAAIASSAEPQVVYTTPPPAPVVVAAPAPAPVVVQAPPPPVVVAAPPAVVYAPPAVVYARPAVPVVYACPPPVYCRPMPPCPPPHWRPGRGPHFRVGFSVGW